ncbi:MAG: winged helix-turn-helix domain-containing tetratricopeptide repeat protein [Acidobacteriota bacterium]
MCIPAAVVDFPALAPLEGMETTGAVGQTSRIYRFGTFTLDPQTGELTKAGRRTHLREQPLQILLALLEKPGALVTREELSGRLWPAGTYVDFDRGLNKAINHLREALGDSAEQPEFVETLPRKGYRFLAPVTGAPQDPPPPVQPIQPARPVLRGWLTGLGALAAAVGVAASLDVGGIRSSLLSRWIADPEISSLAVLPLATLSHDADQEYFADGMTDALITDLAKMGSLRITSRTSVMRYKGTRKTIRDIGRELNVDAVVEGTVSRSGNRVRITAQLIQVSTDMHLWAESYERDLSEVFALQGAVATDIARRINVVVSPLETPEIVNPEAYGLYLKGRYFFHQYTSDGWRQAIEHFRKAMEADPKFASAYSGLADAYLVAGAYGAIPTDDALTQGKAAATRALELDETLGGAHYALATAHTWYDWDWAAAEREFKRAVDLDPNDALGRNWYGGYLSLRGRHEEAVEEQKRALDLDPLSLIANANLTRALYWARRYAEAIEQGRKTLQIDPSFGVARYWLEGALRHEGLFSEAVALREAATTPEEARRLRAVFNREGFSPILRQSAENFRKAGAPVVAARCYAQLGEREQALGLLESCAARRCSSLVNLPIEPDFDPLRAEARFQRLLRMVQP